MNEFHGEFTKIEMMIHGIIHGITIVIAMTSGSYSYNDVTIALG